MGFSHLRTGVVALPYYAAMAYSPYRGRSSDKGAEYGRKSLSPDYVAAARCAGWNIDTNPVQR
jgi:hypothetical protein